MDTLASLVFSSCSFFVPSKKFFKTTMTSEDFVYRRPGIEKHSHHVDKTQHSYTSNNLKRSLWLLACKILATILKIFIVKDPQGISRILWSLQWYFQYPPGSLLQSFPKSWNGEWSLKKHGSCKIFVEFHWSCSLIFFGKAKQVSKYRFAPISL